MRLMTLTALLFAAGALFAQEKLTVEAIYGGEIDLNAPRLGAQWQPNGTHYIKFEDEGWVRYEAESNNREVYLSKETLTKAFADLPGFSEAEAKRIAGRSFVTWNEQQDAILYNLKNDLFIFQMKSNKALRLTHDAAPEVGYDFSPDSSMVSFIRDYNIHLVELDTLRVRQITSDGNKSLLYGRLDWVYQEEIYGRGNFRGYWWSPDGSYFAFLQIDESDVPLYTVVDHIPYRQELEVTHYPKAGDPNPKVRIGVVASGGGDITWMDTFGYEGSEFLVVRVGWHPSSEWFTAQIQNREQNWLDLNRYEPRSGKSTNLVKETSETWVDVHANPHWTPDGEHFVWESERDGYRHLYLYKADGTLERQLTKGKYEALGFYGFSKDGKHAFYPENKDNWLDRHLSRVTLANGKSKRLTDGRGTHGVSVAPGGQFFFDRVSTYTHAGKLALHDGKGKVIREMGAADMSVLDAYALSEPEFLRVPTRDGFMMDAVMIKPPNFDPSKKYPVMSHTYAGPHAPRVRNRWGGTGYLWHQMIAREMNCIIWICDNRTASGQGKVSVDPLYGNFGELELRDLEDGAKWLIDQGYVDASRFGIWGWSYGGYMTLYAMTNSKVFSMGISGAPVTDWRDYDTIYTERYMKMPQNNREGYIKTSPVHNAADLHGDLLIIHGTMDDNVHLQNTIQMINAMQDAGKDFEMMLYPRARHGVRKPAHRIHLYNTMTRFIRENL